MAINNIYKEEVIVSPEMDEHLRACFLNHLVIYNHCLSILNNNPDLTFKELKGICMSFIKEKGIIDYLSCPLLNELRYQYKKFKVKNIKTFKLLVNIHYLTFIIAEFNDKVISKDRMTLRIHKIDGELTLKKDIPEINKTLGAVYVNLSYSNNENKYMLSIFSTTN